MTKCVILGIHCVVYTHTQLDQNSNDECQYVNCHLNIYLLFRLAYFYAGPQGEINI